MTVGGKGGKALTLADAPTHPVERVRHERTLRQQAGSVHNTPINIILMHHTLAKNRKNVSGMGTVCVSSPTLSRRFHAAYGVLQYYTVAEFSRTRANFLLPICVVFQELFSITEPYEHSQFQYQIYHIHNTNLLFTEWPND